MCDFSFLVNGLGTLDEVGAIKTSERGPSGKDDELNTCDAGLEGDRPSDSTESTVSGESG